MSVLSHIHDGLANLSFAELGLKFRSFISKKINLLQLFLTEEEHLPDRQFLHSLVVSTAFRNFPCYSNTQTSWSALRRITRHPTGSKADIQESIKH